MTQEEGRMAMDGEGTVAASADEAGPARPHPREVGERLHEASVTPLGPRRRVTVRPSRPAPPRCLREATDRVAHRRHKAVEGPTPAAKRPRVPGRPTARERIDLLVDEGSFVEL